MPSARPAVTGLLMARLLSGLRREAAETEARTLELRQSESRTRLLLDTSPDAFVSIDGRTGLVTAWNTAAERLFGWSAGEAIGSPLRDLIFTDEGRAEHDSQRALLMEGSEPLKVMQVEAQLRRKDGTTFPAEETLHSVKAGGEATLSAFIRDVSERRRRQREREALLREQAARVEAERVAEMVRGTQLLVDAALAHRTTDDILPELVERVTSVLHAAAATIYLAEEERLVLRASAGGSGVGEREPLRFGEGFAGQVAESRQSMLSHDPAADVEDPALRDLELDSLIGVPLLAEGDVTGVLVVCTAAPRRFTPDDMGLLRLAADRVALGVDRARVYERQHKIAETLQRSLLPDRLPRLPGLAAAARYLPAATEAEVGGDWYDVIPIPGGRVGMVMGDVAGKGLAAASMVGRMRSALRAYALEGHAPGDRPRAAQSAALDGGRGEPDDHSALRHRRPGREHDQLGERRAHAAVAGRRGRLGALPPRRALGADRCAPVSELRGGVGRAQPRQLRRPVHGRPRGATGRGDRPRHGAAEAGGRRRGSRSRGTVRPPACNARPRRRARATTSRSSPFATCP